MLKVKVYYKDGKESIVHLINRSNVGKLMTNPNIECFEVLT